MEVTAKASVSEFDDHHCTQTTDLMSISRVMVVKIDNACNVLAMNL